MVKVTRPPANGFVRIVRKVYNPLGFAKGYNFVLFFIFFFALLIFSLYESPKINYNTLCAEEDGQIPGQCFYFEKFSLQRTGIIMHLACIIPASIMACFQFVPVIRHKLTLVHRLNGYLVVFLCIPGSIGGVIVSRHSFGGGIDTQMAVGTMTIAFMGSMLHAYINIKRLQLEQHRAWMLRAWFYATSIITLRLIMFAGVSILGAMPGYATARPCDEVAFNFGGTLIPYSRVTARTAGATSGLEVFAVLGLLFGPSAWLAFTLHAVGVEIYLRLTPAEHERLRQVSYQRQLKAGMRRPGSAGLTSDRLGDADKWSPKEETENVMMDDTSGSSLPTTENK